MAKQRKRYNPLKSLDTSARHLLKNKAVRYTSIQNYCEMVSTITNKQVEVNPQIHHAISQLRHVWSVHIACFGLKDDQPYMLSEQITTQYPIFQHEITEQLNSYHKKLCDEFDSELVGVGWLASPTNKQWEDDEAFLIYENSGVFNESLELC